MAEGVVQRESSAALQTLHMVIQTQTAHPPP